MKIFRLWTSVTAYCVTPASLTVTTECAAIDAERISLGALLWVSTRFTLYIVMLSLATTDRPVDRVIKILDSDGRQLTHRHQRHKCHERRRQSEHSMSRKPIGRNFCGKAMLEAMKKKSEIKFSRQTLESSPIFRYVFLWAQLHKRGTSVGRLQGFGLI